MSNAYYAFLEVLKIQVSPKFSSYFIKLNSNKGNREQITEYKNNIGVNKLKEES